MKERKEWKQTEILAPAGSYESFRAAILSGADAVYAGGDLFGARAYAGNFREEELIQAIQEAHLYGKKLYLTVNTLLKEKELETRLYDYLAPYYEHGLDAVIVQDLGVLRFVREQFPKLSVHASTQMAVTSALGASLLKKYGVERIVPARELSLSEIRRMKEETGLEIECFVHGALCYSYSGQCLFSSMLGGRSGNRGQCAQPCRLRYQAEGQKRPSCLLSPKDIMTLDLIPEFVEAGIDSFKIEGRMKKPEYVAAVTSMYRKYTDLYLKNGKERYHVEEEDKQKLMDLYNRGGSCTGYYHMANGKEMLSLDRPNHAGIQAACAERQKGRSVLLKALTQIHKGDILEISEKENVTMGQDVQKGGQFSILVAKGTEIRPRTVVYRTRNSFLIGEIQERLKKDQLKRPVCAAAWLKEGEPMRLRISDSEATVEVEGMTAETAKKQPLDGKRVEKQLRKTGNTEFDIRDFTLSMEGDLFVPMQALNELRREALEAFREAVLQKYRRERPRRCAFLKKESKTRRDAFALSALVETREQAEAVLGNTQIGRIYIDGHLDGGIGQPDTIRWLKEQRDQAQKRGRLPEFYLAFPHIFRERAERQYDAVKEELFSFPWDGMLVRNLESIEYLRRNGWKGMIQADHHLYTMNRCAEDFLRGEGLQEMTLPLELNDMEMKEIADGEEELVVYGYCPMMISAGCIQKTTKGCTGKTVIMKMKDRYQKTFYVKNYCDTCYNVIYNTAPLVLLQSRQEIEDIGIRKLRLHFTLEPGAETERVLKLYEDVFLRGETKALSEAPFKDYTRGHFKRGIK